MDKVLINIPFFLTLTLLMNQPVNGQRRQVAKPGFTVGAYGIYAKPKGYFAETYKFGGGGEVFGGVGLGKTFIVATAGLLKFGARSGSHSGALTYTPVKIGIRQFILGKILFVNGDLGMATVKNKTFDERRYTRGIGLGAKLLGLHAAVYYDGWKNINTRGFSNSMNVKIGWGLSL